MILPELYLPSRINKTWQYSGIDSINYCTDRAHFLSYPHTIEYKYNSRGFRDQEWPESIEELQNAIWCIGDSFTVGIGSPYEFTWPQVLSNATGRRCINIGMDGASNTWISRCVGQIVQEIAPTHIVVLWSYFHRRELPNTDLHNERRILHYDKSSSDHDDLLDFINCYTNANSCSNTDVFNATIPCAAKFNLHDEKSQYIIQSWHNIQDPEWGSAILDKDKFDLLSDHIKAEIHARAPDLAKCIDEVSAWNNFIKYNEFVRLDYLDYARDHHHFDKITSEFFVQQICKKIMAVSGS